MLQTALQRQQATAEDNARQHAVLEAANAQELDNARAEAQLQVRTHASAMQGVHRHNHVTRKTAAPL